MALAAGSDPRAAACAEYLYTGLECLSEAGSRNQVEQQFAALVSGLYPVRDLAGRTIPGQHLAAPATHGIGPILPVEETHAQR